MDDPNLIKAKKHFASPYYKKPIVASRPPLVAYTPEGAIGEVRGVRQYICDVTREQGFFSSKDQIHYLCGMRRTWHTPEFEAECNSCFHLRRSDPALKDFLARAHSDMLVPHTLNHSGCGINMWNGECFARGSGLSSKWSTPIAVGLTSGWGKVVEHQSGYRVSHGRVEHLLIANVKLQRKNQSLPEAWRHVPVTDITGNEPGGSIDMDLLYALVKDFCSADTYVEVPIGELTDVTKR